MARSSGVHGLVLAGVHTWGDCVLEQNGGPPLLPVAGQPLIGHILRWLRLGGVREATVCGNHPIEVMRERLGDGRAWGVKLDYVKDIRPRGPAGSARDAGLASSADTFVVVESHVLPQLELHPILDSHLRDEAALTLAVSGDSKGGDNGPPLQEPMGIYVFSRRALQAVPERGYQDIKEQLICDLYRRGEHILTHTVALKAVPRVTNAASYLTMNLWAVEHGLWDRAIHSEYRRINEARVHRSSEIQPGARVVGPAVIGPGNLIERGAMIIGPASVGSHCSVGPNAVLSRSTVWDRCCIASGAVIDHCLLTNDAEAEAGVVYREAIVLPSRRPLRDWLGRRSSYGRVESNQFRRGYRGAQV